MIADEHNLQLSLIRWVFEKFNGSIFMPNFHFMWHEADLIYLTKNDYSTEYEIKISKSDFKADSKKTCGNLQKGHYLQQGKGANYFYYVTPKGLIDIADIPEYAGFIEIDLDSAWNQINVIKNAPRLRKDKTGWIRTKILEKAYHRYLDKITMPALRKNREAMYKKRQSKRI